MRGYQRKVIFLKNTGSPYFDEAYFIMSDEGMVASVDENDMVAEANRIINESLEDQVSRIKRERVKKRKEFLLPFFLGILISVLLAAVVYFLYTILK